MSDPTSTSESEQWRARTNRLVEERKLVLSQLLDLDERKTLLKKERRALRRTHPDDAGRYEHIDGELTQMEEEIQDLTDQLESIARNIRLLEDVVPSKKAQFAQLGQIGVGQTPGLENAAPTVVNNHTLIPQNLPIFKGSGDNGVNDPVKFIETLESMLLAHSIGHDRWLNILVMCSQGESMSWIKRNLTGLEWSHVKTQFIAHYKHPQLQQLRIDQLVHIDRRVSESLQEFCDRFQRLMYESEIGDSDKVVLNIFLTHLPLKIKETIVSHYALEKAQMSSIQEIMQSAIALDSSLSHHAKRSFEKRPKSSPAVCYNCHKTGHLKPDCPQLQGVATNLPIRPRKESIRSAKLCEIVPEASATVSPTSESIKPNDAFMADVKSMSITVNDPSTSSRIQAPILLNDVSLMATIDTGADVTIISRNLAQRLGIGIIKKNGKLRSIFKDEVKPRESVDMPIRIACGITQVTCKPDVLDLSENVDLLIGTDILSLLGIGLVGIPSTFPDAVVTPIQDELPSQVVEIDQAAADAENALRKALENEIQENLNIPIQKCCSLPEAVVHLETGNAPPVFVRQYPVPHIRKKLVDEKVKLWVEAGVITPAPVGCVYNNPLVVVPKKDINGVKTSFRVCIDPRLLNESIANDRYPIPLIRDIFQQMAGNMVFSTIDLKDGYHQFPIFQTDQIKTAFTWENKQWMFARCPFGLKHVTSVFQRVIVKVLDGLNFARNYVDDIIIFSRTIPEHLDHVREVVNRLTSVNLRINFEKSNFCQKRIKLLGFIVSHDGIRADPSKLEAISNWPMPQTGKGMQSFLGFCNYLRNHVPNYSTLASPLEQCKSRSTISWNSELTNAFQSLKDELIKNLVLSHPDFTQPFLVATDASNVGIGAVLFQEILDPTTGIHKDKIIALISRALTKSEKNYSTTKKELLAIVFAIKQFDQYIRGVNFTLLTDHQALTHLFSQKKINAMITNWIDTLLEYNFKVIHLPGHLNVIPDSLSRMYSSSCESTNYDPLISAVSLVEHETESNNEPHAISELSQEQKVKELQLAHAHGHFGAKKMALLLKRKGIKWKGMLKDCKVLTRECLTCQKFNDGSKVFHPPLNVTASKPFDHIQIDLVTDLPKSLQGNTTVLIVVDIATRFLFLRPLPGKAACFVASTLWEILSDFGLPKVIQSDRGGEFVNEVISSLLNDLRISHRLSSSYHPEAQGIVERSHRTWKTIVSKLAFESGSGWEAQLKLTQFLFNIQDSSSTSFSPFQLMFGRTSLGFTDPSSIQQSELSAGNPHLERMKIHKSMLDIAEANIEQNNVTRNREFTASHLVQARPLNAGDKVMVRTIRKEKFSPKWRGPYHVCRRNKGGSYVLQSANGIRLDRTFPRCLLKPISSSSI
jgi:hypothetical protein